MSSTTMISVNAPSVLLNSFDRVCRHAEKSRTAVLIELMRSFVLGDGRSIINESRQIAALARAAKKSAEKRQTEVPAPVAEIDGDRASRRLKTGFAAFYKQGSIPRGE